jgi:hypothetical protein
MTLHKNVPLNVDLLNVSLTTVILLNVIPSNAVEVNVFPVTVAAPVKLLRMLETFDKKKCLKISSKNFQVANAQK